MSALGFTREDYAKGELGDEFEVFPDNWLAVSVFTDLSTQWRVGFAGPVGIDYTAIEPVLRLRGVKRQEWRRLFDDLQVMETEALTVFKEQAERKSSA